MPTPEELAEAAKKLAITATGLFFKNSVFKTDLKQISDSTINPYKLLEDFSRPLGLLNDSKLDEQKAELQIFASILNPTEKSAEKFVEHFKSHIQTPQDATNVSALLQARTDVINAFTNATSPEGLKNLKVSTETLTSSMEKLFVAIQKTDLATLANQTNALGADPETGKVPQARPSVFSSAQMIELSEKITSAVTKNNNQFNDIESPGIELQKQLKTINDDIQSSTIAIQQYKTNSEQKSAAKDTTAANKEDISKLKETIENKKKSLATLSAKIKEKTSTLTTKLNSNNSNIKNTKNTIDTLSKQTNEAWNEANRNKAIKAYITSLNLKNITRSELSEQTIRDRLKDAEKDRFLSTLEEISSEFETQINATKIQITDFKSGDLSKQTETAVKEIAELEKELYAKQNDTPTKTQPTQTPKELAETAFDSAMKAANNFVTYEGVFTQALKAQESAKAAEKQAVEAAEKERLSAEAAKNELATAKKALEDAENALIEDNSLSTNVDNQYSDQTKQAIQEISLKINIAKDSISIAQKDSATLEQITTAIEAAKTAKESLLKAQHLIGIDQRAQEIKAKMAALSNKKEEASKTLAGLETQLTGAQRQLADDTKSFSDPIKKAIGSDALATEIKAALEKIVSLRTAIDTATDIDALANSTKALSDETATLEQNVTNAIAAAAAAQLSAEQQSELETQKATMLPELKKLLDQLTAEKDALQLGGPLLETDQKRLSALLETITALENGEHRLNEADSTNIGYILSNLKTQQAGAQALLADVSQAKTAHEAIALEDASIIAKNEQAVQAEQARLVAEEQARLTAEQEKAQLDTAKANKITELTGLEGELNKAKGALDAATQIGGTDLSDLLARLVKLEAEVVSLREQLSNAKTAADVININPTTILRQITDTQDLASQALKENQALAETAAAAQVPILPMVEVGIHLEAPVSLESINATDQKLPIPNFGTMTEFSGTTLANLSLDDIQTQIVKDQRKTLTSPPKDTAVKEQWDERAKRTTVIKNDQGITANFNKNSADEHTPKIPLVSITKTGEAENTKIKISTTGLPPTGDALIAQTKAIHGAHQAAIRAGGLPGPIATISFEPISEVNTTAVLQYAHEQKQALIAVGIPENRIRFSEKITAATELYKKEHNNSDFNPAPQVPTRSYTETLETLAALTEKATKKELAKADTAPPPMQTDANNTEKRGLNL